MDYFVEKPETGSYHQYKRDQRKVSDWLVDSTHGIAAHHFSDRACIPSRKLIELAEAVATNEIGVPSLILDLLSKVISARRAFEIWYNVSGVGHDIDSDDSHRNFNMTLQQIYALLLPQRTADSRVTTPVKHSDRRKKRADRPRTGFDTLPVEQPSESPLGEEVVRPSVPPRSRSPADDARDIMREARASSFELWCCMKDLRDIRLAIVETWKQFAAGEVSILVATRTLETGITLARAANEALLARHPALRDWHSMAKVILPTDSAKTAKTLPPEQLLSFSLALVDRSDLLDNHHALALAELLSGFRDWTHGKVKAVKYEIQDDHFDFTSHLSDLTYELLAWIKADRIIDTKECILGCSELINGVMEFYKSGELTIWLTMALHTYNEIFEIIGSQPHCGFDAYNTEMDLISQRLHTWTANAKATRTSTLVSSWENSPLAGVWKHSRKLVYAGPNFLSETEPKERVQVKSIWGLPCASGTMLWDAKQVYHKLGITTAGDCGIVLALAHLYTACKRYGLLSTVWADMQFVIAQHKDTQPLVMNANDIDPYTYVKHFLLALGVPAIAFSGGKTPPLPARAKISSFVASSVQPSVSSSYINLLDDHKAKHKGCRDKCKIVESVLTRLAAARSPQRSTRRTDQQDLTPVQLLNTLKSTLIKDEPHINFDYPAFWTFCQDMYLKLIAVLHKRFPHKKIRKMSMPYQLIHHILSEAAMARANRGKTLQEGLIIFVAAQMEAYFKEGGSKFSRQAYRLSSGHIPKEDWPQFKPCPSSEPKFDAFQELWELINAMP
ncbi:hypothetical protein Slin15195_G109390 [Septoria linicola]|uniref:DUF6604 domain-containing protein n=1 Tax=Septoria linicola TaxID=215465 RepID=A0A9Q9AYT9_9PEZI|nr:hypothetical protein Slin14017_G107750 [Septoria linicola]USW57620.1 hypothetical protein Slin15195_G109390 [Septoria linicola]